MTFGSFCLIKNEIVFIREHLRLWLPHLDTMVFYDGNSTDGTLEVIEDYKKRHELGHKIILKKDSDPVNLTSDYIKLSNSAMQEANTDLVLFLHPDMMPENGEALKEIPEDTIAATVIMKSYAGEPKGEIYEVVGRGDRWKNVYRLRNPDLGAHYWGEYGAQNEDTYFSEITGTEHKHHGTCFDKYPYPIFHSNLRVRHYSDIRTKERRLDRMIKCLINQGFPKKIAENMAPNHPRVSLQPGMGFDFKKIETPKFLEDN